MSFIDDAINDIIKTASHTNLLTDLCSISASNDMAAADANIEDVRDNWKPTNFYTPAQMKQIFLFTSDVVVHGANTIRTAMDELQVDDHMKLLDAALEGLHAPLIDPMPFVNAFNQAEKQGIDIIESTGFKRWIVNVLRAARNAQFTANLVNCARPGFLLGAIAKLGKLASDLVKLVKAVGEVILKVGQTLLKIPDLVGSFFTFLGYLPWVVLAFGGYYAGVKTGLIPDKLDPMRLRERQTFKPWRRRIDS